VLPENTFLQIRDLFSKGQNVTEALLGSGIPITFEVIELLYDLQAGTYTEFANQNFGYMDEFARELNGLVGDFFLEAKSVLDCGTGEANTLIPILRNFSNISTVLAIDSSWSRLSWARKNLDLHNFPGVDLAVANIDKIPLKSGIIDLVFTIHALEPNGGREFELLCEMVRVSKKYVILVEPDFATAGSLQKERMHRLNYIEDLRPVFSKLGLKIVFEQKMKTFSNPLNQPCVFVLEKKSDTDSELDSPEISWVDPIFLENGIDYHGGRYFPAGHWYPVLQGIPFLRASDGMYATNPA
jgi:ubiquinone/menaquinone biosynthesis C-methylase UbiE